MIKITYIFLKHYRATGKIVRRQIKLYKLHYYSKQTNKCNCDSRNYWNAIKIFLIKKILLRVLLSLIKGMSSV